ncbi:MAG: glycosyltransferase family 9 protein, partial [Candidatus Cloacimonadales bacterium]
LQWNTDNILWLLARKFDIIYSLDKDNEAIALASRLQASTKKGYIMDEWGNCQPADHEAVPKWHTGLWDDLCKANTKSYPQEIVELCGFTYDNDKYIINPPRKYYRYGIDPTMRIIGLNPGCGKRWLTRLWGEDNWIALSKLLNANGYTPILLGGHDENKLNMRIATRGKALYFGVKPMEEMITIVNSCELVVTSVTMAMHVAIALEKKLVLLNNIFNKHEFELYGLGTILEPDKPCKCCYKDTCDVPCMETIPVEAVYNEIVKLIGVAE